MSPEHIRCFVPVGGQAKRLRPLTYDVAKPCVRFLNRPLIEFAMVTLAEQGVRNFIFGEQGFTNYTNLFDQYGEGVGFSAKYRIEPRVHIKHQPNVDDLGSADSYRINVEYYDVKDPVIVVQGDSLFDINLQEFIKRHKENGAMMTMALAKVNNPEGFGIVEMQDDLRIKNFVEKPSTKEAKTYFANAGIYFLSPEVRSIVNSEKIRKIMEETKRLDFGYDFIPYLINNGFPVYGYELDVWYDIGNPESYLRAMVDVLNGKLNIRVSEPPILQNRNVWVQGYSEESVKRRTEIINQYKAGKLSIEGSTLIGRHTRIEDDCTISDSNIDNYVILGKKARIDGSAVMDAAKIGSYANITKSIIGRKAIIESTQEKPTVIESNSVIGNSVHIREGCRLTKTKVNPNLMIPPGTTYVDKFLQDYYDVVQFALDSHHY